jgi:hypothetical protein
VEISIPPILSPREEKISQSSDNNVSCGSKSDCGEQDINIDITPAQNIPAEGLPKSLMIIPDKIYVENIPNHP